MGLYIYAGEDLPESEKPAALTCSRCDHEITPKKCGGKVYTAKDIAENSEKTYGRVLCWDCMTELRASGEDQ